MAYVTDTELRLTLGATAYLAIFDDSNSGVADPDAVAFVLDRASAKVDGFLAKVFNDLPFATPPPLAREAALEFAVGMSYLRSPEYVRRYGEKGKVDEFERAERLCNELMKNVQRIGDPAAVDHPANVDGGVYVGPDDNHTDGVGCGLWAGGFGDF